MALSSFSCHGLRRLGHCYTSVASISLNHQQTIQICDKSSTYGINFIRNPSVSTLNRNFSCNISPTFRLLPSTATPFQYCTFQGQKDTLPRLPVPELEETMQKFLKSVRPLVSVDEYAATEALVMAFKQPGGLGHRLQNHLLQRAANTENWMSKWWADTAYFKFRLPVVVWSSPGLVFPLVEFKTEEERLRYTGNMIAGALNYKHLLDTSCVPIEMMGKTPLDMSQYSKIFSTCRIPGLTKDSIVHHSQDKEDPPKHIIVMHNNHFFKLHVYGEDGAPLPAAQLSEQLRSVLTRSTRAAQPLGVLTTQNRNVWGQAYKRLKKVSTQNAEHLSTVERALFVVCLDSAVNPSTGSAMTDAALQCVHGRGAANGDGGNRWYDKTIQFVVGRNGNVGITYEHSPAEGPPIANLMDHIVSYMEACEGKGQTRGRAAVAEVPRPERLKFTVTTELQAEIHRAKTVLDSLVNDLEMTCFSFSGFGKKFIKSQKISPDSFIQMAIQLAFYKVHDEPGAQYESGSTRQFLYGRTETIRSCSEESVAFCRAMLEGTPAEKLATLKIAVDTHKQTVMEAISGRGVDRHLLGLKLAAIEEGLDVPPLFMDVSYIRSSHMRISTSQVSAKCKAFMCYGPLVPDGYGCCYNPRRDTIEFGISALNSSPETDSGRFKEALENSLMDMHSLLLAAQPARDPRG